MSIYEERASDIDNEINILLQELRNSSDLDEKRVIFTQLIRLMEAEQNNARIILEFEKLELDKTKEELQELVSSEEHDVAERANEIRDKEAETKRLELDIKKREMDLKERELDQRLVGDRDKLDVEQNAVNSKIVCEAIKVAGIVASGAFMLLGLKGAMAFEKIPDGGIVPSKMLNLIFRMAPKTF